MGIDLPISHRRASSHGSAGAALDLPAHDRRLTCVVGEGTFLNGTRTEMSEVDGLTDAVLAISATQWRLAELDDFWQAVGAQVAGPRLSVRLL
jgi:hypothetical protein